MHSLLSDKMSIFVWKKLEYITAPTDLLKNKRPNVDFLLIAHHLKRPVNILNTVEAVQFHVLLGS